VPLLVPIFPNGIGHKQHPYNPSFVVSTVAYTDGHGLQDSAACPSSPPPDKVDAAVSVAVCFLLPEIVL
jgi:hypothetical protein